MTSSLLTFYLDQSPDHVGRFLHDLWAFSLEELEYHHDFIQWLFPLDTASPVNPDAPTLDARTIHTFRNSPRHQENLLRSLDLMLNFYGLQRTESKTENGNSEISISPAATFPSRAPTWLRKNNHNHLRLTRILRSLHLLGLPLESAALRTCLLDIAAKHPTAISSTTLVFWQTATDAPAP